MTEDPEMKNGFNQEGQNVAGDQTNIAGDVYAADIAYDVVAYPRTPISVSKRSPTRIAIVLLGAGIVSRQGTPCKFQRILSRQLFFNIVGGSGSVNHLCQVVGIPELEEHSPGPGQIRCLCGFFSPVDPDECVGGGAP